MRALWRTAKLEQAGLAAWQHRPPAAASTQLFGPLPRFSDCTDVLISDMAAWSGFVRPGKTFSERWQDEGGLPALARVAIEQTQKFAAFEVLLGTVDSTVSGVMALLRTNGRLVLLYVIDISNDVPGETSNRLATDLGVQVDSASKKVRELARQYCVNDAILLFHASAPTAHSPLSNTFALMGNPTVPRGTLSEWSRSEFGADKSAKLFVGWVA